MLTNSICRDGKGDNSEAHTLLHVGVKRQNTKENHKIAGIGALKTNKEQLLAKFVNQMVATTADLPAELLLRCNRGKAQFARARQISIYLMHTTLSFSFTEIGKVYSKDRTTIAHACRVIEDLRDDEAFDRKLSQLERTIATVLNLSEDLAT